MSSNEQIFWRDSSRTKLPPLNHVLIDRLTLQALAYSTISDLTTLGTGSEDDSLVTGLRGEVLLNRSLMKWTVRWDWSPGLGIHVNYWYEIPEQRRSESFAFCVERKPPRDGAARMPPNHFYAILRMVTQDAEYNHQYHQNAGINRLEYRKMCGRRLRDKWVTLFSETSETRSKKLRW